MSGEYLLAFPEYPYSDHQSSADGVLSFQEVINSLLPLLYRYLRDVTEGSYVDGKDGDSQILKIAGTVEYRPVPSKTDDQVSVLIQDQGFVSLVRSAYTTLNPLLSKVIDNCLGEGMGCLLAPVCNDQYMTYLSLFHS